MAVQTARIQARIRGSEGQPVLTKIFDVDCEQILIDRGRTVYESAPAAEARAVSVVFE